MAHAIETVCAEDQSCSHTTAGNANMLLVFADMNAAAALCNYAGAAAHL